jgi:hypothetical protein
MVCILSSISLFGTGKVVTQSSHERVTARGKLRWSFQKLSMPIARMSCPRPGTSAYPTQTPSLLGHLPISSSSTQFYRSFEAQHLFISLQTASKQSVAFQRCTLNVCHEPATTSTRVWELWAGVTRLYTGKTSLLVIGTRCRLRYGELADYAVCEVRWSTNQDHILLPA